MRAMRAMTTMTTMTIMGIRGTFTKMEIQMQSFVPKRVKYSKVMIKLLTTSPGEILTRLVERLPIIGWAELIGGPD